MILPHQCLFKVKCRVINSIRIFLHQINVVTEIQFLLLLLSYFGIVSHLIRNNRNILNSPKTGVAAVRSVRFGIVLSVTLRWKPWVSPLLTLQLICTASSLINQPLCG